MGGKLVSMLFLGAAMGTAAANEPILAFEPLPDAATGTEDSALPLDGCALIGAELTVAGIEYREGVVFGHIDSCRAGRNLSFSRPVLAARIEGLCSPLGHPELMSREFASQLHAPTESVGEFELKGIPHVQEVRRAS